MLDMKTNRRKTNRFPPSRVLFDCYLSAGYDIDSWTQVNLGQEYRLKRITW